MTEVEAERRTADRRKRVEGRRGEKKENEGKAL